MELFAEGTTITPPGSPDAGQGQQGGAGSLEDQHDDADLQDDLDEEFDDQDDADGDDQDDDQDDEDGDEPAGDDRSQPDNSNKDGLILGKFKSQDDLANAYLNLQREFSKRSSQPQGQQPPAPQTTAVTGGATGITTPEQAALFFQKFQQDPLGTMQYLIDNAVSARTAPIVEQREMDALGANMQQLTKQYKQVATPDGMQQLFSKVSEIAQEIGNPQLAKNPTARILRMAASEAFGDSGQAIYNKAKEEGRRQAEESRMAKKGLPTATGGRKAGSGGKGGEQKSEADQIRDGIVAAGRRASGVLGI